MVFFERCSLITSTVNTLFNHPAFFSNRWLKLLYWFQGEINLHISFALVPRFDLKHISMQCIVVKITFGVHKAHLYFLRLLVKLQLNVFKFIITIRAYLYWFFIIVLILCIYGFKIFCAFSSILLFTYRRPPNAEMVSGTIIFI